MSSNNDFSKLRKIVHKTHEKLQDKVLIKKGNGYQAYSEYNITQVNDLWVVTSNYYDAPRVFSLAKSALAWCIAHKTGKYDLAGRIMHLDGRLAAKQTDIEILSYLLKQPTENPERKFIMQCRLSEDIHNRQSYKQQLAKCVNSTKYIKIKGSSNNELKRFTKTG